ncbi:MAG: plastocyanin/azurin family copper-binding protein [Thermoproteota archaeon]|nr:plastocyanin/azurin family copper-binding protein [Thermoproteota archaeon]
MKQIENWGFYLIVAVMVAVPSILIVTDSMPEKAAAHFNALTDMTMNTNYTVIQEPSPTDNTFIYALNEVAAKSIAIAEKDPRISEIIESGSEGKAVTIAAVQPTVLEYRNNGQLAHSGSGMLIITVNWETINGQLYSQIGGYQDLQGKTSESHQQVWNVMVDLDEQRVTDIVENGERVLTKKLEMNRIYSGMNMFMPGSVKLEAGSSLQWINTSNLPHNIVGTYKTSLGQETRVDSGFINNGESWRYTFNEEGVFEYHCTTHTEHGMKGKVIISKQM